MDALANVPKGLLSQPHLSAPLMTLGLARDSQSPASPSQGQGEVAEGDSLGKEEANPSPAPSLGTSSLLRAVGAPGKPPSPPWLTRGPAVCGGLQVTQQHVPPAPAPSAAQGHHILHQEGLDSSCVLLSPCRVVDRVNTAASSVLASSRAGPPQGGVSPRLGRVTKTA